MLLVFLVFVPLGSVPIYVASYKLDNLIGIFLCGVVLFALLVGVKFYSRDSLVLESAFFYVVVLGLSVLHSSDQLYSFQRYLSIGGYAFLALLIPRLLAAKAPFLGTSVLLFSAFSSLIIWVSYFVLGMSGWGRMTIPTWSDGQFKYFPGGWGTSPDPNILGFGLILSLLFGLAISPVKKSTKLFFIVLTVSATMLTLSRTVFVSGFLALIIAWFLSILFKSKVDLHAIKLDPKKIILILLILFVGVALLYTITPVDQIFERLADKDEVRIAIYAQVFESWLASYKTIIFGVGFDMASAIQDPHNIYVTALHDSGIIGFTALLFFMTSVFVSLVNIKNERIRFMALLIFFFIAIGGLFYWHTKTFWVALMFSLLLRYYDLARYKELSLR